MTQSDNIGPELLNAMNSYWAAYQLHLAEHGFEDLSVTDCDVLQLIEPAGGSMVQIATARGVSKQAIQGQIKSLAMRDYVVLDADPRDGRSKCILLTAKGHDVVAALPVVVDHLHRKLEDRLGVGRFKNLRNMLGQVIIALSDTPV